MVGITGGKDKLNTITPLPAVLPYIGNGNAR